MSDLSFEISIDIPQDGEAWGQLLPEIPQYATLLGATMHVMPHLQYLMLVYRGATPDGVEHRRKSQQRVSLSRAQARALLDQAYPQNARAKLLSRVISA